MLQCTNKKWSTRIVFWLVVCHYSFHLKKNVFLELDIEFLKFQIRDICIIDYLPSNSN